MYLTMSLFYFIMFFFFFCLAKASLIFAIAIMLLFYCDKINHLN